MLDNRGQTSQLIRSLRSFSACLFQHLLWRSTSQCLQWHSSCTSSRNHHNHSRSSSSNMGCCSHLSNGIILSRLQITDPYNSTGKISVRRRRILVLMDIFVSSTYTTCSRPLSVPGPARLVISLFVWIWTPSRFGIHQLPVNYRFPTLVRCWPQGHAFCAVI